MEINLISSLFIPAVPHTEKCDKPSLPSQTAYSSTIPTPQNPMRLCPSRAAGEPAHRTAVPRQFPTQPKSTLCTGSRPGGAGSWSGTRARQTVSLSPDFLLPACTLGRAFLCPLTHCLAPLRPVAIKEDVLLCDPAELGVALSRFVQEVRRPNGESYGADSVFYLCLGIQQVTQAGALATARDYQSLGWWLSGASKLSPSLGNSTCSPKAALRTSSPTSCTVSSRQRSAPCSDTGNPSFCPAVRPFISHYYI